MEYALLCKIAIKFSLLFHHRATQNFIVKKQKPCQSAKKTLDLFTLNFRRLRQQEKSARICEKNTIYLHENFHFSVNNRILLNAIGNQ